MCEAHDTLFSLLRKESSEGSLMRAEYCRRGRGEHNLKHHIRRKGFTLRPAGRKPQGGRLDLTLRQSTLSVTGNTLMDFYWGISPIHGR